MARIHALLSLLLLLAAVSIHAKDPPASKQAYVTLLYGDEFLLGVRVLGQSIRDTGTSKDLLVLVSEGVSRNAIETLEADGWIVERIELLANPNRKRPKRFWGVYTKLKIFNLTQYDKIVYLDADTIVVKSIDDLFQCQKFCANLKHSERLNSGVMVVEPSQELFEDMVKQVSTLYSYTGGDQGFLNSYYPDFPNAQLFDPSIPASSRQPKSMERLSTLYNADVGLYMLANKWMVDGSELRVVHYTLGPLKPWDWWTEWLLKPVDLWQNVRTKLKNTNSHNRLYVGFLVGFPVASMVLLLWLRCLQSQDKRLCGGIRHFLYRCTLPIYSTVVNGSSQQQFVGKAPSYVGTLSILVFFLLALLSTAISFWLIPPQVMPWTGMFLLYQWTFFLFTLSFGKYLDMVFEWGKRSSGSSCVEVPENYSGSKGHFRSFRLVDPETATYGFTLALLAVVIPCLPFIFNVTALFSRLGMIVGAGMLLVAFSTYAAEHLGIRWFMRGRDES